jgi:hypothetical protein
VGSPVGSGPQPRGRAGPAVPPGKPFELRGPSFRLGVPEGWSDRSVYCVTTPGAGELQATFAVTRSECPRGVTLADCAQDQLRQLAGQLAEFQVIRSEKRLLGTRECQRAQFTWKTAEGLVVRQSQWYLQQGDHVFALTATAPVDSFAQFEPQFDQLVAAFTPVG